MNKGLIIGIICLAIVSIIAVVVVVVSTINKPSPTTTSPTTTSTGGPTTRPPLNYIQSTGGLYLICEFDKPLSTTKVLSEATPVTFSKCSSDSGVSNEYCLMFDNKNVRITGPTVLKDGTYTIFIHSLSETTYIGLLGAYAYLDLAKSPIGFYQSFASDADLNIWNVVTM
jgi:hypothetical protein